MRNGLTTEKQLNSKTFQGVETCLQLGLEMIAAKNMSNVGLFDT